MISQLPTLGTIDPTGALFRRVTAFPTLLGLVPNLYGGGSASSVPDTGVTFTDNTTGNISSTKHGFAPKSPADATQFLNGAATPAFAQVKGSDLSMSDVTTNNVSNTAHGFAPKNPNDATKFLDGTGAYSTPAGSGATAAQLRSVIYKTFTPGTDAYEFVGSDLANFTAVNSGLHTVVTTEDNDRLSLAHPGGDASAELHAWVKSATINANNFVEAWVGVTGKPNAALSVGVLMSDGNTYNGANTQVFFDFFNTISTGLANHTKFNTVGTSTSNNIQNQFSGGLGIRLQYLGSNNWAGFISLDGENWVNITGTLARTMTPAYYGFFVSTWGSSNPANFTVWYVRLG